MTYNDNIRRDSKQDNVRNIRRMSWEWNTKDKKNVIRMTWENNIIRE